MYEAGYESSVFGMFWLVWLGLYLFFGYCQYRIAQKVGHESPWQAWIPIVQVFQQVKMADREWWWFLLYLVPIVNIFAIAMVWSDISQKTGNSSIWGIFMLVPFLNLVSLLYLAFSAQEAHPFEPIQQRQPEKTPY